MSSEVNTASREPMFRTVKHDSLTKKQAFLLRIGALLVALMAGGVFILLIGYSPLEVYRTIITGSFRSAMAIQAVIKIMVPLVICALSVTLAFKMKFWNIGAEGQMIMGAVFASYFALYHSYLNHFVLLFVMLAAGMLGGGLWGLIPAFFKTKFGTNETLLTLMLNYIALNIIVFLREGIWRDPESAGYAKIANFADNAVLDKVFGVHIGWIIALVLVALVFVYIRFHKHGYEISVVGDSKATANYAGMSVKKIVLRTMFISGGIAGIGGMIEACGSARTLSTGVAGGVGFTAIIVAWLARLNPIAILIVTFLFAILEKGSSVVETSLGLSSASADVLQGIILFFVLGCEFFVQYKFIKRKKGGKN